MPSPRLIAVALSYLHSILTICSIASRSQSSKLQTVSRRTASSRLKGNWYDPEKKLLAETFGKHGPVPSRRFLLTLAVAIRPLLTKHTCFIFTFLSLLTKSQLDLPHRKSSDNGYHSTSATDLYPSLGVVYVSAGPTIIWFQHPLSSFLPPLLSLRLLGY